MVRGKSILIDDFTGAVFHHLMMEVRFSPPFLLPQMPNVRSGAPPTVRDQNRPALDVQLAQADQDLLGSPRLALASVGWVL